MPSGGGPIYFGFVSTKNVGPMVDKSGLKIYLRVHRGSHTHNTGASPTCVLPSGVGDLACIACYISISCFVTRVHLSPNLTRQIPYL